MLTEIRSAELKARWAKEHLEALQTRIRRWVKEEASNPITQDDIETGHLVITLIADEPPADIALIAGDFLCSLVLLSTMSLGNWPLSMESPVGKPSFLSGMTTLLKHTSP